jgi:nucleotide-binding universal stress UspA family protein
MARGPASSGSIFHNEDPLEEGAEVVMAMRWKTVCCPVDFSEPTQVALGVAADLCSRLGSNLVLLHVDGVGKVAEELAGGELVDTSLAAWKADAQRLGAGNVTVQRVKGQAEIAIVDYAARGGVDLIVMGTHGRMDREKMLAGSVTESVTRNAGCPVMTVHPGDVH